MKMLTEGFPLPLKGIYSRKEMKYINGMRRLVTFRYNVEIVRECEKSFLIILPNGRQTLVGKKSVLIGYEHEGYCLKRGRYLFNFCCKTCFEKCAYSFKDFPQ